MVRNEEKYQEAIVFRRRGFTYSEIAKICSVSKATVSNWLSKESFSQQIRQENTKRAAVDNRKRISLLNKAKQSERARRYAESLKTAEIEYRHYQKDPLFVAGLSIYLAHGDVSHETLIRLSSNRPTAQRVFINFLKQYLGVTQTELRLWLLVHEQHNVSTCLRLWSKKIGVSPALFGNTQFVKTSKKNPPLHFGTLNTIIGNTVLKRKLQRWVELLSKNIK